MPPESPTWQHFWDSYVSVLSQVYAIDLERTTLYPAVMSVVSVMKAQDRIGFFPLLRSPGADFFLKGALQGGCAWLAF